MYALICIDKPNSLALRLANRDAHLKYVGNNLENIVMSGPLTDGHGQMSGSMFLFNVDDPTLLEGFTESDPYSLAGLFEYRNIHRWNITYSIFDIKDQN